jgi:hypothetical protein
MNIWFSSHSFHPILGLYKVDCKASGFTWSIWAAGNEFDIDAKNIVWEYQPGTCFLAYEAWEPGMNSSVYCLYL